MNIVAHPLVVAVALGLLGPSALEEREESDDTVAVIGGAPTVLSGESTPLRLGDTSPTREQIVEVELAWSELGIKD